MRHVAAASRGGGPDPHRSGPSAAHRSGWRERAMVAIAAPPKRPSGSAQGTLGDRDVSVSARPRRSRRAQSCHRRRHRFPQVIRSSEPWATLRALACPPRRWWRSMRCSPAMPTPHFQGRSRTHRQLRQHQPSEQRDRAGKLLAPACRELQAPTAQRRPVRRREGRKGSAGRIPAGGRQKPRRKQQKSHPKVASCTGGEGFGPSIELLLSPL